MSAQTRPKPVRMTICDLCGEEISDNTEAAERGSILGGWLAHPVGLRTKWAWLKWPPAGRERRTRLPRVAERRYDFHADCIFALVEQAVVETGDPDE